MKTRAELIQEIDDEHAAWQALVNEVGEDRIEEPGPMGDWTFKDLTAHVTFWQDRMGERIKAGPKADPPAPWPASMGHEDEDDNWQEINDWIYAQHRDRPLQDVLAEADRSYANLAALITTLPEEVLMTPGYFDVMGDMALIELNFFEHFHDEHEPSIRAWLESQ